MSNSVRNKNLPWSLVSIRQIYVSHRVGDFAQKSYPRPNYPGGTLRLHLIDPLRKIISPKSGKNLLSVVWCSVLGLYTFTFEKGKIKISYVSLLYCYHHFLLSAKRGFSVKKFQLGPRKGVHWQEVSAKNCPLYKDASTRIYIKPLRSWKVSAGRKCPP